MQTLVEEIGERLSNMLDPVLTREEIVDTEVLNRELSDLFRIREDYFAADDGVLV